MNREEQKKIMQELKIDIHLNNIVKLNLKLKELQNNETRIKEKMI